MLKYFIIFLFCILCIDVFSQVVIKEEVILYPEEVGDTLYDTPSMPFYGRVRVERLCNYIWWWGNPKFKATVGNQTYTTPCYNCPPQCGVCQTGSFVFIFDDVPLGTGINLEEQICGPGGISIMPLRLIPDGENRYRIQGNTSGNNWNNFGSIRFTPTTPPGCDNASPCSNLPQPPTIFLESQENGFHNVDVCEDINYAAGFEPVWAGPIDLSSAQINVCFNEQTQKWQYEFANGHTVRFYVVIDVCENNINYWGINLIEDYDDFPLSYGCENVMRDMINHLLYPPGFSLGSYYVRSILIRHELEHKLYFENILYELKNEFQNNMYRELKNCEDIPTVLGAINYFNSIKIQNLLNYWDKAIDKVNKETGLSGINDEWLKKKIFWAHERATHFKISKFIFQKINAARNYYCF